MLLLTNQIYVKILKIQKATWFAFFKAFSQINEELS